MHKMPAEGMKQAIVFDIERYATKDGPGIRTVVFFKGCNLRCLWCQNPESHRAAPQIMYDRSQCTGCDRCLNACPRNAISQEAVFGLVTDQERCTACGACVEACYANARRLIGRSMFVEEVMEQIVRDKRFYKNSGGGVTFSGGEPLLWGDFVVELARRCRDEGIHTAIETAGLVPSSTLESISEVIDLVYFDLKHIDRDAHYKAMGVYPEQIQKNLIDIAQYPVKLIVRIPLIPPMNNSKETMEKMFRFIKEKTSAREVELLAFHRLGLGKYEGLGLHYAMKDIPNLEDAACEEFAGLGREMDLVVHTAMSRKKE